MSHCIECRKARYVNTGKNKEYNQRTYAKNRDARLAKQKEQRSAAPEKYKDGQRRWYQANKGKVKAKVKAYREANLDKIRAYLEANREYRLAKKGEYRKRKGGQISEYSAKYRARHRDYFLDYMQRYNVKHRTHILELKRAYREKNKDLISEKFAEWYAVNREANLERTKEWQRANKHKVMAAGVRRRLRVKAATIQNFSFTDLRSRIEVFGNQCAYCAGPVQHMDHVKPISKGGLHCLSNLRPACARCNLSKNAKSAKKWLARIPRAMPLPLP